MEILITKQIKTSQQNARTQQVPAIEAASAELRIVMSFQVPQRCDQTFGIKKQVFWLLL